MNYPIQILQQLGAGGNGDIYIGQRLDTREFVVVKYLREPHLPHARKAFEREVRILQRKLRGIVPLISADLASKRPYYVMPYLPGGPLTQHAGRLFDVQLHSVAFELAQTFAMLHAANIYHGDIKPDNILVSGDGTLQVADPLGNGIGCTFLFSQNRGGTPGYWAPEVRNGAVISSAGDVYSYGVTLYQLLTGRKPKDGQKFDPRAEGYGHLPAICEIISVCCDANPAMRPTMAEVCLMVQGNGWSDILAARKKREEQIAAVSVMVALGFLVVAFGRMASNAN
jgi:eukaryotic-like serine/threonine-protein kinase